MEDGVPAFPFNQQHVMPIVAVADEQPLAGINVPLLAAQRTARGAPARDTSP